jgi:predicted transcriptional regulator
MKSGNETGKPRVAVRNPAMVTRVLELRKDGHSISLIARELGLSRPSVRKYLATAGEIASSFQEQIDAITQAALESVKAQILDRNSKGDGRLALDFAKCTVFAEQRGPSYNIAGDVTLQQAINLLPSLPAASGLPPANATASGEAPGITIEPAPAVAVPDTAR